MEFAWDIPIAVTPMGGVSPPVAEPTSISSAKPAPPAQSRTTPNALELRQAALALQKRLCDLTHRRVRLILTDNRSTVISTKNLQNLGIVQVRAHHMFAHADENTIKAFALWVAGHRDRKVGAVINEFIARNRDRMAVRHSRPARVLPRGRHHNLKELFDEVNRSAFQGEMTASVTWGQWGAVNRRQRGLRLGSFSSEQNLIRIHPVLDRADVPRFFVRYIMFHEMLHEALGIRRSKGNRNLIHTKEFKETEQKYFDYERAIQWEKDNLTRLLKHCKSRGLMEKLHKDAQE
jgi:hypothetical protein